MSDAYIGSLHRKIIDLEGELDDALGREDELGLTIETLEEKISDLQEQLEELGGEGDE